MTDRAYHTSLLAFLGIVIAAQVLFAAWPSLDLAVSHLLAGPDVTFAAPGSLRDQLSRGLRLAMETASGVIILGTFAGAALKRLKGPALRCWAFFSLNLVVAPGLIVNVILKDHLGRARPLAVAEFGGSAQFTPAWQISDQCLRNCSFTSGEVSVAATLAICLVVLIWARLPGRGRPVAVIAAAVFVAVVSYLRLVLGRHFLSDAVFSILISAGTAFALYAVLRIGEARQAFVLPGMAAFGRPTGR